MKTDIYESITNQIVAAIERGAEKFVMPWHQKGENALFMPVNATSGKAYRGVNILALWAIAEHRGYSSGEWATFKQWTEAGAKVRKGEKGGACCFLVHL